MELIAAVGTKLKSINYVIFTNLEVAKLRLQKTIITMSIGKK